VKGGLGTASSTVTGSDALVGALVVCNAVGDVIDDRGDVIAGARNPGAAQAMEAAGPSTVLVCVATNAVLDKGRAIHVARMASAGIARAVRPAFTFFDGDIVFCAATQQVSCEPNAVGTTAADVVAEALRRGVRAAKGLAEVPGLAD
jgi:L-aminopeptidase/D-esterase-like protein